VVSGDVFKMMGASLVQHAAAEVDQKIANMLDQRMREARDDARGQG